MSNLTRAQHIQLANESKFRMKKKLLSLGYQMHWHVPRSAAEVVMPRWQVCKNRIDAFCLAQGAVKKEMDHQTASELSQCITQLQRVCNDFLKKI